MWDQEEESDDTLIGQLCEGYEVLGILGSGTFGKVYKVQEVKTEKLMAMKHVLQNKKYKNRELDIMRQIQSQFVVRLHHHFYKEEKEGIFLNLVMEYLPEPLSKIIKTNLPYKKYLSVLKVKNYTKCLLMGLKDLHNMNICHRDIKPSNILVSEEEAKICDFGSAKVLNSTQKNIAYICSRYYRAPELLLGAIYYSSQVDIWSMGCVLVDMMTNHVLFEGSNTTSMLSKIIKCLGAPTPQDLKAMKIDEEEMSVVAVEGTGLRNRIFKLNPNSPEQLVDLVQRMVVYDPTKRITAGQALTLPLFN